MFWFSQLLTHKLKATALLLSLLTSACLAGCNKGKTEPVVELQTTQGNIVIQLHPDYAPQTVELFLKHVDSGFYTDTIFHRVIPNFMAQGGGFNEDIDRKEPLGTVVNESQNGLPNKLGTIAMARTNDPDSASSQFFINVVDNPNLDAHGERPGYTVFGTVTQGVDIAIAITKLPVGRYNNIGFRNAPNEAVIITSAKQLKPAPALTFDLQSSSAGESQ